ncbi:MAG: hypothetical protein ACUVSO_00840 [Chloroflexus sp.]
MAAALQTARPAYGERVRKFIQHVLAQLGRRTVTGLVAQNSTHGDHSRWYTRG